MVMLHIRNILSSNFDPENSYPDWKFCVFYELEYDNVGIVGSALRTGCLDPDCVYSLFKLFDAVELKRNYFVNRETNSPLRA
jgi:hypothetical protein